MLDSASPGTFNTVGPGRDVTLAQVLEACRRVAEEEAGGEAGETRVTWAEEQFLRDSLTGVTEEERPLWFPEDQIPFESVDSSKALAAGLSFRSIEETARAILWNGCAPGCGTRTSRRASHRSPSVARFSAGESSVHRSRSA
jgi:2'-hydroxyisoflavone reductase